MCLSKQQCPLWVICGHLAVQSSCPLYPRNRTCAVQLGVSAKGQKRTLAHSISFLLLCKFFCAPDYLDSYVPTPLIVDEFGLLSERLNIGR